MLSWFTFTHYVTIRAICSVFTSFCLSLLLGAPFIRFMQTRGRSGVRAYTPDTHKVKGATPTLGGLLMLLAITGSALLWLPLSDPAVCTAVWLLLALGGLGALDDWQKIKTGKGISERAKWCGQVVITACAVTGYVWWAHPSTVICVPVFKQLACDIGWLYPLWMGFIILATSNAVNLTDGLDGLAISTTMIIYGVYSILSYVAGHAIFAHYLHIPFVPTSELAILCSSILGAALGFLWFNAYPAQIFMGDAGSLPLGGCLGFIACACKQELLLPITGILLVVETLSVIIQVAGFKTWGIRVFRLAPIHHHFEKLGWPETKITMRATIITALSSLIALFLVKIR